MKNNSINIIKWIVVFILSVTILENLIIFFSISKDVEINSLLFWVIELIDIILIILIIKVNKKIVLLIISTLYIIISFFLPIYNESKITNIWYAPTKGHIPGGLRITTYEINDKNIYGITIKSRQEQE